MLRTRHVLVGKRVGSINHRYRLLLSARIEIRPTSELIKHIVAEIWRLWVDSGELRWIAQYSFKAFAHMFGGLVVDHTERQPDFTNIRKLIPCRDGGRLPGKRNRNLVRRQACLARVNRNNHLAAGDAGGEARNLVQPLAHAFGSFGYARFVFGLVAVHSPL